MEIGGVFLATVGTAFLALVFARAVLHKLGAYAEFVGNVANYKVFPESLTPVVAPAVLALECLTVVGLLVPVTRVPAAALAAALLAGYAIAIARNLARGRTTIDCGCGGGGHGISPLHVLRNALLAAFAIPVIVYPGALLSGFGPIVAVGVASVLVLWVTFLIFDQLLGNHTHASATTFAKL